MIIGATGHIGTWLVPRLVKDGHEVPEWARRVKQFRGADGAGDGEAHALGCNRAMLLDGGLSSQLAVRSEDGSLKRWTNWRQVPLGLVIAACAATCKRQ